MSSSRNSCFPCVPTVSSSLAELRRSAAAVMNVRWKGELGVYVAGPSQAFLRALNERRISPRCTALSDLLRCCSITWESAFGFSAHSCKFRNN